MDIMEVEHMDMQSQAREASICTIKRTQQRHGTQRAPTVRRDQVPQTVRTSGGFVHLLPTAAASLSVATASAVSALTMRTPPMALRLALAYRMAFTKQYVLKTQEGTLKLFLTMCERKMTSFTNE